jgi:hypothetical protein
MSEETTTTTNTKRVAVSSTALFDIDSVLMDSPRLQEIKAHDIQTHYCRYEEEPWLAIPMRAARAIVGALPDDPACNTLPEIMANYCGLLDDADILFYGMTEREAQDRALDYLSNVRDHRCSPEASDTTQKD